MSILFSLSPPPPPRCLISPPVSCQAYTASKSKTRTSGMRSSARATNSQAGTSSGQSRGREDPQPGSTWPPCHSDSQCTRLSRRHLRRRSLRASSSEQSVGRSHSAWRLDHVLTNIDAPPFTEAWPTPCHVARVLPRPSSLPEYASSCGRSPSRGLGPGIITPATRRGSGAGIATRGRDPGGQQVPSSGEDSVIYPDRRGCHGERCAVRTEIYP